MCRLIQIILELLLSSELFIVSRTGRCCVVCREWESAERGGCTEKQILDNLLPENNLTKDNMRTYATKYGIVLKGLMEKNTVCFQNGNLWLHENSCYVYMWERRNMEEANEICKGFGGYLTHIETLEENNLLETMLRSFNHNGLLDQFTWIGLTDEETEGVFKWLGETTEANFTHFGPVEPSGLRNENCVALYSAIHYFWADINCHPHLPYICEYEF